MTAQELTEGVLEALTQAGATLPRQCEMGSHNTRGTGSLPRSIGVPPVASSPEVCSCSRPGEASHKKVAGNAPAKRFHLTEGVVDQRRVKLRCAARAQQRDQPSLGFAGRGHARKNCDGGRSFLPGGRPSLGPQL
jgi:hypothetical protein